MGNRSFIELGNAAGPYLIVAESNNNLPSAWFALLNRHDLATYLQHYRVWEATLAEGDGVEQDRYDPPPCLRIPVARAYGTSEAWARRLGVAELKASIATHCQADDDELLFDWSQYRGFYDTANEFALALMAAFDQFTAGQDPERSFDQVGELRSRSITQPTSTPEFEGHDDIPAARGVSVLDREWVTWALGAVAACAGLATWAFAASPWFGIGAFLLVAVSAPVGIMAWERSRQPR